MLPDSVPCYFYLAVLYAFSFVQNRLELTSSLLFFRNYLNAEYSGPYTVHLWSLAVEEHFYLLWPPIFVLVRCPGDFVRADSSSGIGVGPAEWLG
jgi:peptidoglycan/LPS O-acetylase OafA/YrhL